VVRTGSFAGARAPRTGAWVRVAVVSPDAAGEVVVRRESEQLLRRALARVPAGALAVDESLELRDGPVELRVELRLVGAPLRVASVMAVLKKAESHVLHIELRPTGLAAELR
jgi:hypothetical protein